MTKEKFEDLVIGGVLEIDGKTYIIDKLNCESYSVEAHSTDNNSIINKILVRQEDCSCVDSDIPPSKSDLEHIIELYETWKYDLGDRGESTDYIIKNWHKEWHKEWRIVE